MTKSTKYRVIISALAIALAASIAVTITSLIGISKANETVATYTSTSYLGYWFDSGYYYGYEAGKNGNPSMLLYGDYQ